MGRFSKLSTASFDTDRTRRFNRCLWMSVQPTGTRGITRYWQNRLMPAAHEFHPLLRRFMDLKRAMGIFDAGKGIES